MLMLSIMRALAIACTMCLAAPKIRVYIYKGPAAPGMLLCNYVTGSAGFAKRVLNTCMHPPFQL